MNRGRGRKTGSSRRRLLDEPSPPPPPPPAQQQNFFSAQQFHYQSQPQFPSQPAYNQFTLGDQYPYNPFQQQTSAYVPDTSHFRDQQQEEEEQEEEEEEEEEEEHDEEQEEHGSSDEHQAQPSGQRRSYTKRVRRRAWVPVEEVALVKSYIGVSVSREQGNSMRTDTLWGEVLEAFRTHIRGTDRSVHQLNSKWKDMQKKMNYFTGFVTARENARQSGWTDADVIKHAKTDYLKVHKKKFDLEAPWEILRNHQKWQNVGLAGDDSPHRSSKRTKTSESNANTSGGSTGWTQNLDEDETTPTPAQRKGKQHASSRQEEMRAIAADLSQIAKLSVQEVESKNRYREEKLKILAETEKMKAAMLEEELEAVRARKFEKDLSFFMKPHDHLHGPVLESVLKRKREIAQRQGWEFLE